VLITTSCSLLLAGSEEVFQIQRQELRSSWQISGRELAGGNTGLNRPHGNVEDLRQISDGVCGSEWEVLDKEKLLEEWVLCRF